MHLGIWKQTLPARRSSKLYIVDLKALRPPSNVTLPLSWSVWQLYGRPLSAPSIYVAFPYLLFTRITALYKVYSKRIFLTLPTLVFSVFQVCWVPSKMHLIANALSQAPLFAPEELPGLDIDTAISRPSQTSQPSIRLIYDSVDGDYHLLLEDVKKGSTISTYSQALKGSLDILSVSDDLVLLDSRRIVLPGPLSGLS